MQLMEIASSSLRLGLDGSEKGVMETADISSSTNPPPQTANIGKMAKVLPERVRRLETAVGG